MLKTPLIFLSAGEASGDHYGAELIAAVKAVLPQAGFTGLGGAAMEAEGQQRVVRAEDVAVMGITEILRHIPRILGSYFRLVKAIKKNRPDVAVLIDFPDVNFRLAKHLKRLGVPVIWFVSPQLWAWKRSRLRWVQQRVWKMLTIFPFEETFYANRGVTAEFVGHPLAEQALPTISREVYAREQGLSEVKQWVALLPGSRGGEIDANLPALLSATALLGPAYEYLLPVAPTVSRARRHAMEVATNASGVRLVSDARAALLHSRAAAVASGTATVQAAVIGTPFVLVYRVSNLTFKAAKRLVRYPVEIHAEEDVRGNLPIGMVNLVAGRRVVPELLQEHFTGDAVAAALKPLLEESPERAAQIAALAEVRHRLQSPSSRTGIESLRNAVLEALELPAPDLSYAASSSASK
ncbi:lipid-A-disaccharide synthase [Terriglobus roseus]|uniref:Lipid-A-disaccharide synthase n=1 Tax=Terriglobus roseus TaxID=392734 RepID=A0A1H4JF61_9BACT|nr:lipid-A-disaccharide synthase [Terriglobus roseus]SEB44861.1 lipid-A-disaccharide synthase [Terriglobus roseus]